MLVKADQWDILKLCFISFWSNALCIKNQRYNQVILKNNFKAIKIACVA